MSQKLADAEARIATVAANSAGEKGAASSAQIDLLRWVAFT